jgi:undecaprenyl-diphosphatase
MNILKAIIMGVIQGLTEFLPVSSSGHLAIFGQILNLDLEGGVLFEVVLHIGTLLAIFIVYHTDIKELIVEGIGIIIDFFKMLFNLLFKKGNKKEKIINTAYRKFVMLIIVGSIPTGIIGLLFKDFIESAFDTLLVPGICLFITGGLLLLTTVIKQGNKMELETKYSDSLIIGTFQGLATLPGISRSGSTLVGGLICGLDKEFAVKFSFIMSIPAIIGAAILQIKDIQTESFTVASSMPYILGMLASGIVGYICIKTLLAIIKKNKLHYFAYYCFAVGTITLVSYVIL